MEKIVYGALAIPYKKTNSGYRYLLLKHQSGLWTFPGGGKDEEDVTLEDCLIRELREEIGLDIDKAELVPTGWVNKFTYGPEKPSRNGMNGETHFWLLKLTGDEKLGSWDKIIDHGWFTDKEILDLISFEDERKAFLDAVNKI